MTKDYYKILDVPKNADEKTIRNAYKELARKWHPDKNKNNVNEATEKLKDINEAKDVLLNPEKREIYDQYGEDGLKQSGQQTRQDDVMNDIFKQMFGMHNAPQQNDVPDVEVECEVTLEQMFTGTSIKKQITRFSLCSHCHGTGSDDGIDHKCLKCNGQGKTIKVVRMGNVIQQIQQPCNSCLGIGHDSTHKKCTICTGARGVKEVCDMEFPIPAGAFNGTVISVKNQGNEIPRDERKTADTRSNIKIIIKGKQHSEFKRMFVIEGKKTVPNPADLLYEMTITLAESICGFRKIIKHLNGQEITVQYEKCTKNGDILILPNLGMPVLNSQERGDLYVSFKVLYPEELDKSIKSKVWTLLTKLPSSSLDSKKDDVIEFISLDKLNNDPKYKKTNDYRQYEQRQQSQQQFHSFQMGGFPKGFDSFFQSFKF